MRRRYPRDPGGGTGRVEENVPSRGVVLASSPPSWRRPLLQMALSTGVTMGVLGAAEGAMRLTGLPDPGLYEGDRALVWWLRPHLDRTLTDPATGQAFAVHTSAEGFRGDSPPASGPWTLAVGCSTTFGWAVAQDDAWPAVLAKRLGEPVINGGTPGWSTAQGVRGLPVMLDRVAHNPPARVVLAFGVRDHQAAARPDSAARPTPWLLQTRWALLLGRAGSGGARAAAPGAGVPRVGAAEFGQNIAALVDLVARSGATPSVMVFPQPGSWPPDGYAEAARDHAGTAWLELPAFPRSDFFADDPIHLTPHGHAHFAEEVHSALFGAASHDRVDVREGVVGRSGPPEGQGDARDHE